MSRRLTLFARHAVDTSFYQFYNFLKRPTCGYGNTRARTAQLTTSLQQPSRIRAHHGSVRSVTPGSAHGSSKRLEQRAGSCDSAFDVMQGVMRCTESARARAPAVPPCDADAASGPLDDADAPSIWGDYSQRHDGDGSSLKSTVERAKGQRAPFVQQHRRRSPHNVGEV